LKDENDLIYDRSQHHAAENAGLQNGEVAFFGPYCFNA